MFATPQRVQWAGRRSNPRLRLFRPLLDRLSYRPKRKKPDVAVTPGFEKLRSVLDRASTAQRMRGQLIRRKAGATTLASLFAYRTRPLKRHAHILNVGRLEPAVSPDGPVSEKVQEKVTGDPVALIQLTRKH